MNSKTWTTIHRNVVLCIWKVNFSNEMSPVNSKTLSLTSWKWSFAKKEDSNVEFINSLAVSYIKKILSFLWNGLAYSMNPTHESSFFVRNHQNVVSNYIKGFFAKKEDVVSNYINLVSPEPKAQSQISKPKLLKFFFQLYKRIFC